jgi:glycosyltransferase involved in cell wall biosynthesis
MNVVMIGPFAFQPKGTVSARAFFIARALVERGHRATILMPPYDNPADSGRVWEQDGVRLENLVQQRDDAWHRLVVPLQLARRATRLDPDLVHVFKPIGYSGLAGLYLRRLSRRPLVLDTDDWEGPGGWSDVNAYPALWRRFFAWQERWLPRHADAVTVASRTLQARVQGLGVDPGRVAYLPNGPDPQLRALAEISAADKAQVRQELGVGDAPFVLYLGHIPRGSDLDLAVEAVAQLSKEMPEVRLVVAGVGEGLESLRRQIDQLTLAGRVLLVPGWIEHGRAPRYLAAADAVVAPYRDTLINRARCPAKVVQAMALGRPVVTSRVGQNVEYIEHGRSGLLAKPGDASDLARALRAVLSDREMAAELGRNAWQRIWERFDWAHQVTAVEEVYGLALRAQSR